MTGSISGEADLRHWLIDYLVTNIGCTPDEVDPDLSLADLGVSSRDAVVLSGELSELLGRTVSPIDFWEHPTINALAAYLAAPEPSPRLRRRSQAWCPELTRRANRRRRHGMSFPWRDFVPRSIVGLSL